MAWMYPVSARYAGATLLGHTHPTSGWQQCCMIYVFWIPMPVSARKEWPAPSALEDTDNDKIEVELWTLGTVLSCIWWKHGNTQAPDVLKTMSQCWPRWSLCLFIFLPPLSVVLPRKTLRARNIFLICICKWSNEGMAYEWALEALLQ